METLPATGALTEIIGAPAQAFNPRGLQCKLTLKSQVNHMVPKTFLPKDSEATSHFEFF